MGSKSSPPPAPNYGQAAQQTADSSLKMAQAATTANRVNQYSPNGSITYQQNPDGSWAENTNLSPGLQQQYNQNQQTQGMLGNINSNLSQQAASALANPLSMQGMQQVNVQNNGSPQQFNQDAANAAYANATQYLNPRIAQEQESLNAQLANQGLTPGSQAYNNAMQQFNANSNQQYQSAQNNAYLTGQQAGSQNYQNNLAGNNQIYNQQLGLQQNQLHNAQLLQGNALGLMGQTVGLQGANPVTNPQMLNLPQQQTTTGADMLGAAQSAGTYNLGVYNAQMQQQADMAKSGLGLFGTLGGEAIKKGAFDGMGPAIGGLLGLGGLGFGV